ncbi:MAG: wbbL4 [Betaproteobacteria bacterium]|nr:wbbL4 [Betaproteobacteria bacterium]
MTGSRQLPLVRSRLGLVWRLLTGGAGARAEFQARVLRRSLLFSAPWYLRTYPEVAAAGVDPVLHYLARGAAQGYDPGPRFSTRGYAARHRIAGLTGINPLAHWEIFHPAAVRRRSGQGLFVGEYAAPTQALAARFREAQAARRLAARTRVLIIDDGVPLPSEGAGFPRACALLRALCDRGVFVTHYPRLHPEGRFDQAMACLPPQVEIIDRAGAAGLAGFLREHAGAYDLAIVSRPHNMAAFREACRSAPGFAGTPVIYDAEAIFALRDALRAALGEAAMGPAAVAPGPALDMASPALVEELQLAVNARIVLTVNEAEAARFRPYAGDVRVLGPSIQAQPAATAFDVRRDLLFIGRLLEDDSPNADSMRWFVRRVMPLLDALIGDDYKLEMVGPCSATLARELGSQRVRLHGRVDDLAPFYATARVFVAPTRFASGTPQKVYEAAAHGVPVVASGLLAGQLGWRDQAELLAGDCPRSFAAACARLYSDAGLWASLRQQALARVRQECDPVCFGATLQAAIDDALAGRARFPPV